MRLLLKVLVFGSSFMMLWHARAAPGDLDPTFDPGSGIDSFVYTCSVQPDGKLIVGGRFTTVAGLVRKQIARLNPDGTGDPSFNPGSGVNGSFPNSTTVVAASALQPDGKVLIGGSFTEVDGISRNGIARLNADGTLDRSFDSGSGANNLVNSILLQPDGKVLIGGYFTRVNGTNRNFVARLNEDGSVDSNFTPRAALNTYVYAIALQPDGKIVVGGGGPGVLVRLDAGGNLDTSFHCAVNDSVYAVEFQTDGKILVGGSFRTVNGIARQMLARLRTDGSLDPTFDPGAGFDGMVRSLAMQTDGKVLVGGNFRRFNGTERTYLARLNDDGSLDDGFDGAIEFSNGSGPVYATTQSDGKILLFGVFSTVGGRFRNNLARLNPDATLDVTFSPFTGIAESRPYPPWRSVLPLSDGKLLMSGLWEIRGTVRHGLARITSSGELDSTFEPLDIPVSSMVLQPDGKVLLRTATNTVSTNMHGLAWERIARINPDGTLDETFAAASVGPGVGGLIHQMVLQHDGKLLVSGNFESVNGVTRDSFARLNGDGTLDMTFNPKFGAATQNQYVQQMLVQTDGKILVAGYVTGPPAAAHFFMRLNPDGTVDPSFNSPTPLGALGRFALKPDGKVLIAVWIFDLYTSTTTRYIARLNQDGTRDLSFGRLDQSYSWPFVVQPDGRVVIGHTFYEDQSSSTLRPEFVRLNADGTRDTTFNPIRPDTVANLNLMNLTLLSDSKFLLQGAFGNVNGVPRWYMARFLGDAPVIITQPASRTNAVGTTATFSVAVSGAEPLLYQWYKNGAALFDSARVSGSTSHTLSIAPVLFADAGTYTVAVSNSAGSVMSDAAFLRVRVPPIARIRISPLATFPHTTNLFVISPNNISATITLDGSLSNDEENTPLEHLWLKEAGALGTGALLSKVFPTGAHKIKLVVDNGTLSGSDEIEFEVITPSHATAFLGTLLHNSNLPRNIANPLAGRLKAISALFDASNFRTGLFQLQQFQHNVREELSSRDTVLTGNLVDAAQEIINALDDATTGRVARIHALGFGDDGSARIEASPGAEQSLLIEASTNLRDWKVIGVYRQSENGSYEFNDTEASQYPMRFYRIVLP
jgi:uncharacterized delta-60 repeat protein